MYDRLSFVSSDRSGGFNPRFKVSDHPPEDSPDYQKLYGNQSNRGGGGRGRGGFDNRGRGGDRGRGSSRGGRGSFGNNQGGGDSSFGGGRGEAFFSTSFLFQGLKCSAFWLNSSFFRFLSAFLQFETLHY